MNVTNYLGYIGYAIGLLSAIFAYLNRDRYKTLVRDIYEPGNKELREQLATARAEISEVALKKSGLEAALKEKESHNKYLEELNAHLPDYSSIVKQTTEVVSLMSNNHKEMMKKLTELAKKITEKVEK